MRWQSALLVVLVGVPSVIITVSGGEPRCRADVIAASHRDVDPRQGFHFATILDFVAGGPVAPTPEQMVASADLIVLGTVVAVLPAQWTTPDCCRPAEPWETVPMDYTIITPALLKLDGPPIYRRAEVAEPGELMVVATYGGTVGASSVSPSLPLRPGSRLLIGMPREKGYRGDHGGRYQTSLGSAWSISWRWTVSEDGQAVNAGVTSVPFAELIRDIQLVPR